MGKGLWRMAVIVLSFISVVLALSTLRSAGLAYWYLFFSPLILSAIFFGFRGSLVVGLLTLGSLDLLHRNVEARYASLLSVSEQGFRQVMEGISSLPPIRPDTDFSVVISGASVMVLGALFIGYLNDQRHRQAVRLNAVLAQDPLTGLLNRQHFILGLRRWSGERRAGDGSLSLILLDVDRFGEIQARYGHYSADLVLERIAQVLSPLRLHGHLVARLGSDEFGIAIGGLDPLDVRQVAEGLRRAIAEFDWTGAPTDGSLEPVTASFGVAFEYHDGLTPSELLRAAWQAVESQKLQGGAGISYASLVPEVPEAKQAQTLHEWREIIARLGVQREPAA